MTNLSKGIIIHWLKPKASRDYANLIEGVDFKVINPLIACPSTGGESVSFTGVPDAENYE